MWLINLIFAIGRSDPLFGIKFIFAIIAGVLFIIWFIYALVSGIKKQSIHEKVMENFRTIQPNIIGMTYDEIIEKLEQSEDERSESAGSFSIRYKNSADYVKLTIHFLYNEENGKFVCSNYSL